MKKILMSLFLLMTVAMPMTAFAQDAGPGVVAPPSFEEDPSGFFEVLFQKVQSGEWLPALALVLMVIVFLARKMVAPKVKWFGTKFGGFVLSFLISLTLAVATALFAGQAVSLGLISMALGVAWTAAGGWEHVKDVMGKSK